MTTSYLYPYRRDGWDKDIYPMPAFPQLTVSDLNASIVWYQDVLGFADVFTMRMPDGTPMLGHLRWCTFGDLMLLPARAPLPEPRGRGVALYFSAQDVDGIVARAAERRVEPVEGPVDRPWNVREVGFVDPDGYRVTFGAQTAEMLARVASGKVEKMEDVVDRLRRGFER